jgi:hypothetical protein
MLHEFRNHLTRLLAGTTEIRSLVPRATAADLAQTLDEMEASLQNVTALAGCIDAIIRPGEQVISDVSDVIERALATARPWLGDRARITVGSRVGAVRNRSGAAEGALAVLLADLGRPADGHGDTKGRQLHVDVFSARGVLAIEIESNAAQAPPLSWRRLLAERLAATVGGVLEPLAGAVGVCLKFQ